MATKQLRPAKPRKPAVHVKDMNPKAALSGGATTVARPRSAYIVTFGGRL